MNLTANRKKQSARLRRCISLLLTILIVSLISISAFAELMPEPDISETSETIVDDIYTSTEANEIDEADEETDEYEFVEPPSEELEILIMPASFAVVTDETELVDEINAGTPVIMLGADIYISGANLTIPAGADITLDGNFILSRANNTETGSFITIDTGASLTINGVHIVAPAGVTDLRGILVTDSAALTFIDGSISGFDTSGQGGGVSVEGGNFEMYSGIISGNTVSWGGGGVSVVSSSNTASFIMWGGEISDNISGDHGGGIYLASATFEMWGGEINSNTAGNGFGGGIILDADGIMDMHGGEINGNSAPWGGGVATHGGQFTMYDGSITNNTAQLGGGIYDEFFSSFPYISAIHGGEVSGNTAEFGGGIYVEHGASFTVNNATISENTAELGGGIYVAHGASFTVNNVTISDNTAEFGGGIYVTHGATLDITGLSFVINNNAQSGGGIYTEFANYGNLTIANTVAFSGNLASAAYVPPENADTDHPNIQYASSSIRVAGIYWNPINNFDINHNGVAPIYFVHYFANGGIGSHTDIDMLNAEYTVLSNTIAGISRTDYNFTGWNTEADGSGTSYVAGDTIIIVSNIDLYAQWEVALTTTPPPTPTPPSLPQSSPPIFTNRPTMRPELAEPEAPEPYTEMFRRHFVNGYPNGTFQPNGHMTRAEMMQIFFNISNPPPFSAFATRFTDMATDAWYFHAVAYLQNRGVIQGFPDGTLRPDETITNAEFAALAVKFFNLETIITPDTLIEAGSHWAANYINLGFTHGWFEYFGITETFDPDAPITRAQAVALLNFYQGRTPDIEAINSFLASTQRNIFPDVQRWHWSFYEIMEAAFSRYYYIDSNNNEIWLRVIN